MQNIPVNQPLFSGNEKKYLMECIDTGWISSEGPFIEKFEKGISSVVSRKHGIAVTNGTAALEVSIAALDIGPGDEVILPTFTIISCISQIIRSGATPILVDVDPFTWNMNADDVINKITNKTKLIIVVHIYGLPVDMDPILEIAKNNKIKVLEDAAEMLGQTYKGKPCGSFGDISTFSFYPNKHITTGEGGMVLTNDDELAIKIKGLRNLCFEPSKRFVHQELGWNLRMTNLQAAVGLAQLENLAIHVEKKRRIGLLYTELLRHNISIQLPIEKTLYAENIYWVYGVIINEQSNYNAVEAMRRLGDRGIGTRPFFYPMHQQPILKKMGFFKGEKYPVAEKIAEKGFYIPSGLALEDNQILNVVKILNEVIT